MARRVARATCVVAILGLLLVTVVDPGSGTGTNLQAADDVASLVVGAHHAKTVPASAVAVLGALMLAVAAVLAGPIAPRAVAFVTRRRRDDERPPRTTVSSSAHSLRAPPAAFSA